jgi:beta-glucosidase
VALQPGETKTVTFELHPADLAYYDVQEKRWAVEPAKYIVYVGASSREEDLLTAEFHLMK